MSTVSSQIDAVQGVLDRLERVRQHGNNNWSARCPAHEDRDPSLSIGIGSDERVLLHCHAGCATDDVVAAIGLEWRDLFPDDRAHAPDGVLNEYRYYDADGTLVYVVVRKVAKNFVQKRPDGNGGWIWNLRGVQRVPYGLPQVLDAVERGERVYVVEGEKDADRLRAAGFVATCNSGGVGKWDRRFGQHFAGADVVIVPDNDVVGAQHALDVAASLDGVAGRVRIVELPDLPPKGDVSDWFALGRTTEEFLAVVDATPPRAVTRLNGLPAEPLEVSHPGDPFTNAKTFVQHMYGHVERPLLAHEGGIFYRWDGTCWPALVDEQLKSQLYEFFARCVYWNAKAMSLVDFSPTRAKVTNLVDALAAAVQLEDRVIAPAWLSAIAGLPAPAEVVACANGLLHIATRELRSHTPAFYVHHAVPFDYAPDASPPRRWLQFLHELWPDDLEVINTLQELIGYLITGATHLQKMFLLVGPPRSGKSTIGRVIHGLLGSHNVAGPTLHSLGTNFGLASLINKPVALISDARLRSEQDVVTERLLSISGEDMLTVDRKYKEAWIGRIPSRIVILTNELPRLGDMSGALANRFIIMTFTNSFLGKEDPGLTDALLGEIPSIFNWALDGLDRLTERGHFVQPESSRPTMQELEDLGSPLKAFVRDCCELEPDAEVGVDDLYQEYRRWCDANGRHAGSVHTFGKDLRAAIGECGPRQSRKPPHRRYIGIRVVRSAASLR